MSYPKNHAIIENGIVINVIWVCEEQAQTFGAVLLSNPDAGIGWRYENGDFMSPEVQANDSPEI